MPSAHLHEHTHAVRIHKCATRTRRGNTVRILLCCVCVCVWVSAARHSKCRERALYTHFDIPPRHIHMCGIHPFLRAAHHLTLRIRISTTATHVATQIIICVYVNNVANTNKWEKCVCAVCAHTFPCARMLFYFFFRKHIIVRQREHARTDAANRRDLRLIVLCTRRTTRVVCRNICVQNRFVV